MTKKKAMVVDIQSGDIGIALCTLTSHVLHIRYAPSLIYSCQKLHVNIIQYIYV